MKNLLEINNLTDEEIQIIFSFASRYRTNKLSSTLLKGKIVVNAFFENSTRTSLSFDIAAKLLGAHVIHLNTENSSLKKGETLLDTLTTISNYNPDFLVIRHPESGILHSLPNKFPFSIINGGDGTNEHPTQALTDAFTLAQYSNIEGLKIGICGDILHSRVAHSTSKLFKRLGGQITLIGPSNLLPSKSEFPTTTFLHKILPKLDVLLLLRIQQERMQKSYMPSLKEYYKFFGLTLDTLSKAKKDLLIMHPGPFNRNIEIASQIVDRESNKNLLINKQMENSIAIRQAVFQFLSGE